MLNRGSALFHENPPGAFAQFEGRFDLGDLGSANAPYLRRVGDRGAIYAAEIVKGIQKADGEVHAPLVTAAGPEEDSEELVIVERPQSHVWKPLSGQLFSAKSCSLSPSGYYLIRAPVFTSLSSASTESIPSLSVAARSIPCDSMPMSFAGFRFARTTIFFPTSSSGE